MNNTDKKLGRRKAGSWGRTRKAGKRIGNKATRKASKADMFDLYCTYAGTTDPVDRLVQDILRKGITA